MSATDIIALLALIVATYGAILSTYTAINEFFRLKLTYLNKHYFTLTQSNHYLNECGEYIDTFEKDSYSLYVLVRLVNKSKNPTTINEIVLNDKYIIDSASDICSFVPISFKFQENCIVSCDTKRLDFDAIKPLLELKPLSTFEGYLIFNNIKEIPSTFKIKVNAIQKSKTFNLDFKITNDHRNNIAH